MNAEDLKKIPGIKWDTAGNVYADSSEAEKHLVKYWLSECELGQEFAAHYNGDPNNMGKLVNQFELHGYRVSLRNLDWVFTQLRNAGKIITAEAAEAAAQAASEAAAPKDKHGKPLTQEQQKWSEYRVFSETHNMDECRARARRDDGYASFMRTNYQREGLQHGEGTVLNGSREMPTPDTPADLLAWVREYLKTPADQVRKLRRTDTNPLGFQEYNRMFELAVAKNLI